MSPARHTVIIGDLSGLQSFLFAVSPGEGGQAKALRARSFYIQTLAECCAMKFQAAGMLGPESLVFCGAAKFVLSFPTVANEAGFSAAGAEIEAWLLQYLGGQLSFGWAMESGAEGETALWSRATGTLQARKLRPWSHVAQAQGSWRPEALVLAKVRLDSYNRPMVPDRSVFDGEEIGKRLPSSHWLEVAPTAEGSHFRAFDYGCKLHRQWTGALSPGGRLFALSGQRAEEAGARAERRYLAKHIPTDRDNLPLTFETIAQRAQGDRLLGVLKMDADSLGAAFERLQGTDGAASGLSNGWIGFFRRRWIRVRKMAGAGRSFIPSSPAGTICSRWGRGTSRSPMRPTCSSGSPRSLPRKG